MKKPPTSCEVGGFFVFRGRSGVDAGDAAADGCVTPLRLPIALDGGVPFIPSVHWPHLASCLARTDLTKSTKKGYFIRVFELGDGRVDPPATPQAHRKNASRKLSPTGN